MIHVDKRASEFRSSGAKFYRKTSLLLLRKKSTRVELKNGNLFTLSQLKSVAKRSSLNLYHKNYLVAIIYYRIICRYIDRINNAKMNVDTPEFCFAFINPVLKY